MSASQYQHASQVLQKAVDIALSTDFYEGLISGMAVSARPHRLRLAGDAKTALLHAGEAVGLAVEKALPMNVLWGRLELGLAYLAQGNPLAALEQTGPAVPYYPRHTRPGLAPSRCTVPTPGC